jgi:hypothetical protein
MDSKHILIMLMTIAAVVYCGYMVRRTWPGKAGMPDLAKLPLAAKIFLWSLACLALFMAGFVVWGITELYGQAQEPNTRMAALEPLEAYALYGFLALCALALLAAAFALTLMALRRVAKRR